SYSILHDTDKPEIYKKDGSLMTNPAWTNNTNILSEHLKKSTHVAARLLASVPNFEEAYFGELTYKEKPYSALKTIEADSLKENTIKNLFDALINYDAELPRNCIEWRELQDLEALFK